MDGLGRHEHRNLENTHVLDTTKEPAPEVIDAMETDDEVESSFFSTWTLPIVLFLLTVFTTKQTGSCASSSR